MFDGVFVNLQVHVLPPSGMNFPPTKVEAAVGTVLPLPLAVSAKVGGKREIRKNERERGRERERGLLHLDIYI